MQIQLNSIRLTKLQRTLLLTAAILALLGPNALYLYYAITNPALNTEAIKNPIALAFMIEAMMLLSLFLWYVYRVTRSWVSVFIYLGLSFLGSLAFSFPLFLHRQSNNGEA